MPRTEPSTGALSMSTTADAAPGTAATRPASMLQNATMPKNAKPDTTAARSKSTTLAKMPRASSPSIGLTGSPATRTRLRTDTTSVTLLPCTPQAKPRIPVTGIDQWEKWLADLDTAFYRVIRTSREHQESG